MRRIGVLSGSFDPIHLGHIRMADTIAKQIQLDEVVFVPVHTDKHKRAVSLKHRTAMIALAIAGYPLFSLSDMSFPQDSPSVYDIVRAVKARYRDADVYYLVGADRLPGMQYWQRVGELYKDCTFVACPRPGHNIEQLANFARAYGARVHIARGVDYFPAAELVRTQIALLSDALDMLAPEVACYIARNGLYLQDYEAMLKPVLNQSRLQHTLSVRETAVDLSFVYHVPLMKTSVAAMLHDCAKCLNLNVMRQLAIKHKVTSDTELLSSTALLHGVVGAYLAEKQYQVRDMDVLNAIRYHTTGRAGMSMLELCIFVADTIEPKRHHFAALDQIRMLAAEDLRLAAIACLKSTQQYIASRGGRYANRSNDAIHDLLRHTSK